MDDSTFMAALIGFIVLLFVRSWVLRKLGELCSRPPADGKL